VSHGAQYTHVRLSYTNHLGCGDRIGALALLDDGRRLGDLLPEEVALDEVRKPDLQLIAEELFGGDREDLVDFFERLGIC
jgi:hypothetical protein